MSLKSCIECNSKISESCRVCPVCGFDIDNFVDEELASSMAIVIGFLIVYFVICVLGLYFNIFKVEHSFFTTQIFGIKYANWFFIPLMFLFGSFVNAKARIWGGWLNAFALTWIVYTIANNLVPAAISQKPLDISNEKLTWSTISTIDEMSGVTTYHAFSPKIFPTSQLKFPYKDVFSYMGVSCQKGSFQVYLVFNKTNLSGRATYKNGNRFINTKVKFDENISDENFVLIKGREDSLYFSNQDGDFISPVEILQRLISSSYMLLQLNWHGNGDVYFRYDLNSPREILDTLNACEKI